MSFAVTPTKSFLFAGALALSLPLGACGLSTGLDPGAPPPVSDAQVRIDSSVARDSGGIDTGRTDTPVSRRDAGHADASARDAGSDAGPDVPPVPIDAGSPDTGPLMGVSCGSDVCEAEQYCCSIAGARSCRLDDDCVGSRYLCDGPEDCPGEVCCGEIEGFTIRTGCRSSCGSSRAEVCHPGSVCSDGRTCMPFFDPPGGGTCR